MADQPVSGGGIKVGDAVLTFLGDTSNLEQAWTRMEQTSKASATRTVSEVLKQYDRVGIEGSVKLNKAADEAAAGFAKLKQSGVASMSDLIQAEQKVLETTSALKSSLGQSIPLEVIARVESLKMQYVGLTGTIEQFEAQQLKSVAVLNAAAVATDRNTLALKRERDAMLSDVAAAEADFAAQNELSAAKLKAAVANSESGLAAAGARAGTGLAAIGMGQAAAVLATVAALGAGAKASLEFGKNFAELTTLIDTKTPDGVKQVAMLKQQILDLDPALGKVPELTRAAYEALSSNIPVAQVAQLTASVSQFAQTWAHPDLFAAMDVVTTIINAYGVQVKDADHVTAALFETIKLGKVEGPELAANLGRVIPVAHNIGASLNEVLAAIAAMTIGGLSADESVTALRQVLVSLEHPSKQAEKAAMALGVSLSGVRQEIQDKGLNVALGGLAEKMSGNIEAAGELFGNVRALTGIMALSGPQAKQYATFLADIAQASKDGTAAQEAMAKVLATQQGQLSLLANTVEHEFIVAWEKLLPVTNSFARSLMDVFVNTGLVKVAGTTLAATLLTLAVVTSTLAFAIDSVKVGLTSMGIAFVTAAGYITGVGKLSENATRSIAAMTASLHSNKEGMQQNTDNITNSLKAFDDLVRGTGASKTANEQYAAAQKLLAESQQKVEFATRQASAEVAAQKQKLADAASEHKLLAQAIAKTTKAMEAYANSHGIPLAEELNKNVAAAQKFAQQMIATGQPVASQTAAILNLNIQLGKLKSMLSDGRSVGQMLQDIGNGKDGAKQLEQEANKITDIITTTIDVWTGEAKRVPVMVSDPMVDAFNTVLEAEQRLGIQGTVTLSKHAADAEKAVVQMRYAFEDGKISAYELRLAEDELARANLALAGSFKTELRQAADDALKAEKALGIQGTQTLMAHRDAAQAAYEGIKAGAAKGVEGTRDLELAELHLLETQVALDLQMGKIVPDSTISRLRELQGEFGKLTSQQRRLLDANTEWYQFWHTKAPSTAGTMREISDIGKTAFLSLADGMGNAVAQAELGQKSLGEAIQEATAQALASISAQATVHALWETAQALASFAVGDFRGGTQHLAAAAEYGVVAAAAGVAASALSGGGGGGSSSSGASSGSGDAATPAAIQPDVTPVNATNVQRYGSGGIVSGRTLAMIGDSRDGKADSEETIVPTGDSDAMDQIAQRIAAIGGQGNTTHVHVAGLISADNLDKVMKKMNERTRKGTPLHATQANRVVGKS